jgi:hypothetical protein
MSRENPTLDASKPAFLCGLHRGLLADAPGEELTLGHFGCHPCAACGATPTTYHWLKWRRVSAERDELVAFLREHGPDLMLYAKPQVEGLKRPCRDALAKVLAEVLK